MTDLVIELEATKRYMDLSAHMEQNYPGITERSIYDPTCNISNQHTKISETLTPFISPFLIPITFVREKLIYRDHRRLLESFEEKLEGSTRINYLDRFAKKRGIELPDRIKSYERIEGDRFSVSAGWYGEVTFKPSESRKALNV